MASGRWVAFRRVPRMKHLVVAGACESREGMRGHRGPTKVWYLLRHCDREERRNKLQVNKERSVCVCSPLLFCASK